MSERQPTTALHGGPFEPGPPQGPAPGPGPPALLTAQDSWMFESQFNKVCFPFPPGFGFAPKEPDDGKDEGLTARLLDKPGDGSSPRAGTPAAGGVGYRPWEQEGFEGARPGDKDQRPFSNGQDKGSGSPGLGSQDSSQSSERMPTPVDKMASQHPAPPFPMQHHPFADFPPAPRGTRCSSPWLPPRTSPGPTSATAWRRPPPPGTPDAMDKGTKKKRKRCGECPGCLKKDNCGECGPCRSVRSHQICKMRKCDQLKTKKEKERYEKMMHQMHERRRGTPDENKNMQQIGGFSGHSEYQLPPTAKSGTAGGPNQMYESGPSFGTFPAQHPQVTRQSQKEQGPFQGLESTLGPAGNFVHPQPAQPVPDEPMGHQQFSRQAPPNEVGPSRSFPPLARSNSGSSNSGSHSNGNARPPSSSELPAEAWHEANPSVGQARGRPELPEFAKNGSSSQGSNNSEAEFSQPEDQSRESEFADSSAETNNTARAPSGPAAPTNGMLPYGNFYGAPQEQSESKAEACDNKKTTPATSAPPSSEADIRGGAPYHYTSAAFHWHDDNSQHSRQPP
ncbi:hypothetical protein MTO96_016248 [Rhipicephalus appendiculatus]